MANAKRKPAHRSATHRKVAHRRKSTMSRLGKAAGFLALPIPDVELAIAAMANPESGIKFVLGIAKKAGKRASEVQSVIFDKVKWTVNAASGWLKDHGFTAAGKDEGATFWRFRQQSPSKYKEFRTIVPGARRNPEMHGRYEHPAPMKDWRSEVSVGDRIYKTLSDAKAAWYDSMPGRNDHAKYVKVRGGYRIVPERPLGGRGHYGTTVDDMERGDSGFEENPSSSEVKIAPVSDGGSVITVHDGVLMREGGSWVVRGRSSGWPLIRVPSVAEVRAASSLLELFRARRGTYSVQTRAENPDYPGQWTSEEDAQPPFYVQVKEKGRWTPIYGGDGIYANAREASRAMVNHASEYSGKFAWRALDGDGKVFNELKARPEHNPAPEGEGSSYAVVDGVRVGLGTNNIIIFSTDWEHLWELAAKGDHRLVKRSGGPETMGHTDLIYVGRDVKEYPSYEEENPLVDSGKDHRSWVVQVWVRPRPDFDGKQRPDYYYETFRSAGGHRLAEATIAKTGFYVIERGETTDNFGALVEKWTIAKAVENPTSSGAYSRFALGELKAANDELEAASSDENRIANEIYESGSDAVDSPTAGLLAAESRRKRATARLEEARQKAGELHRAENPTPGEAISSYDEHLSTTMDPDFAAATPDEQAAAMTAQDLCEAEGYSGAGGPGGREGNPVLHAPGGYAENPRPIVVGDKVKYTTKFLRSIGAYTGPMGHGRGIVTDVSPMGGPGSSMLATIDWRDGGELPERVNVYNLIQASVPNPYYAWAVQEQSPISGWYTVSTWITHEAADKMARELAEESGKTHRVMHKDTGRGYQIFKGSRKANPSGPGYSGADPDVKAHIEAHPGTWFTSSHRGGFDEIYAEAREKSATTGKPAFFGTYQTGRESPRMTGSALAVWPDGRITWASEVKVSREGNPGDVHLRVYSTEEGADRSRDKLKALGFHTWVEKAKRGGGYVWYLMINQSHYADAQRYFSGHEVTGTKQNPGPGGETRQFRPERGSLGDRILTDLDAMEAKGEEVGRSWRLEGFKPVTAAKLKGQAKLHLRELGIKSPGHMLGMYQIAYERGFERGLGGEGNPSSYDSQHPDLGQAAFEAGKAFRLSGAYNETGVANARVAKYGFSKWYNGHPPAHLKGHRKATLLKNWMEGWAAGKRVEKRQGNPGEAAPIPISQKVFVAIQELAWGHGQETPGGSYEIRGYGEDRARAIRQAAELGPTYTVISLLPEVGGPKLYAVVSWQHYKEALGKSGGHRNPESSAADLYEEFHGKPPGETKEIITEVRDHEWLTQLGALVELKIATVTNLDATLSFEKDAPDLCSGEDGRQLYIEGGDQGLDLAAIKMSGDKWLKDSMVIGTLYELTYSTKKGFHKFRLTDYFHKLGEETGEQPTLLYDPNNRLLSISGGQYQVKDVGIVN